MTDQSMTKHHRETVAVIEAELADLRMRKRRIEDRMKRLEPALAAMKIVAASPMDD